MSNKKMNLSFEKGAPSFLMKLKQQHGIRDTRINDKFVDEENQQINQFQDYDVDNAQIINQDKHQQIQHEKQQAQVKQTNKPVLDSSKFRPSFIGKKQKNQKIIELNIKNNKQQRNKKGDQKEDETKGSVVNKTKKILKPNKNLLSFDD